MSSNDSIAFKRLRPSCVAVSRNAFLPHSSFNPDSTELLSSLEELNKELKECHKDFGELSVPIADYVFVPLAAVLKQESLGDTNTREVLRSIALLVRICWSRPGAFPLEKARQLSLISTYLISSDKENSRLLLKTGDFKATGIDTLAALVHALSIQRSSGIYHFFEQKENLPQFGHMVTILLDLLLDESLEHELKLVVISILRELYASVVADGEILSFVLPGNISSLSKLLAKPGLVVNYKLVCAILDLLAELLSLVYNDADLQISSVKINSITDIVLYNEQGSLRKDHAGYAREVRKKCPHRDNKWLKGTSGQVKRALDMVLPKLLRRNNPQIKQKLIEFAQSLLKNCGEALYQCQELLVTLVLSSDENESQITDASLHRFESTIEALLIGNLSGFDSIIQRNDYTTLETMRRAILAKASVGPLEVAFINNMLGNFHESLNGYITQATMRLGQVKIKEQSSQLIVTSYAFQDDEELQTQQLLPALDKLFERSLSRLITAIGSRCATEALDALVDSLLSSHDDDNSIMLAVWISSRLIEGYATNVTGLYSAEQYLVIETEVSEHGLQCVYSLLEQCQQLLNISTTKISSDTALPKSNETMAILSLNGILTSIRTLGEAFKEELIDYLYPIVDCLASPSENIRTTAQSVITELSNIMYGGSIENLLLDNVDYITDCIAIRLDNCVIDRVSTILGVICKLAGYEIVTQFQDILEKMFRMLDFYHGYDDLCLEFFQLFEVIVDEMKRKYFASNDSNLPLTNHHITRSSFKPWGMDNIEQVITLLDTKNFQTDVNDTVGEDEEHITPEEYFRQRMERDSDDEDDNEDDEAFEDGCSSASKEKVINTPKEDEWNSPISRKSYLILLQILVYGDRLLTHPSRQLKVQILKVTKKIIPMLATQYNSMLPKIARMWDLIVAQCISDDYSTAKEAFRVIDVMIEYSGDFLTKRFSDLWETLKEKSQFIDAKSYSSTPKDLLSRTSMVSIEKKALNPIQEVRLSMCKALITGASTCELHLPDEKLSEMLNYMNYYNIIPYLDPSHTLSAHCIDILYSI
ncbi:HGL072Wp [Eremothecium sinecaudum]|uniref:HGL072Wp n=1 Tax=Eremothecium sinecaudum TaxID=45286 RepID=A0A0X8HVN4_9SACH|nr:HGL072Wp [Eremothecium sinecaudum]AMD22268.1 HGL072Wp [Eremothecium sinecaudum]